MYIVEDYFVVLLNNLYNTIHKWLIRRISNQINLPHDMIISKKPFIITLLCMYLFIFQVLLFLSWSAIITKSGPRRWSKDMSVCAIITIIIIIIKYWIIVNCVESSCFFLFLCPKISFLWLIVAIYYREKKVSYRVDILENIEINSHILNYLSFTYKWMIADVLWKKV